MKKQLEKDIHGHTIMSQKNLAIICERNEQYQTPEHNESLYLNFKGFSKISSLDRYVNVCAIWLNNNGISTIEGLECLQKLNSLFLNNNLIKSIENLQLPNLLTLNLSHNAIYKIENLWQMPRLQSLNLSNNHLTDLDSIQGIQESPQLQNLDLQQNHILYDEEILTLMKQSQIACLYFKGNPITREFPQYRKRFIVGMKSLLYLDDKPVTVQERRISEAWSIGGQSAELNERNLIDKENRQEALKQFEQTELKIQQEARKQEEFNSKQQELCAQIRELQNNDDDYEKIAALQDQLTQLESRYTGCYSGVYDDQGNAVITNTSSQEAEIIKEKYFNKEIIENNTSQKAIIQANERKAFEAQVIKEQEEEYRQQFKAKWTKDHDLLLENLLLHHQFDFDLVDAEFRKIMTLENQDLGVYDLRQVWTNIEKRRRSDLDEID